MSMKAPYSRLTRVTATHGLPTMNAEEVVRCPKCSDRLVPQLLDINSKGEQNVWWTCASMNDNLKSCNFPLAFPSNVFWVKRTPNDIRMNIIPKPNVKNLPPRYRHLYPSLFSSESSHSAKSLRKEKTKTRSDGISAASSDSGMARPTSRSSVAAIDRLSGSAENHFDLPASNISETERPVPTISPGIGDLCTTPLVNYDKRHNHASTMPSTAHENTSNYVIGKEAKTLEQELKSKTFFHHHSSTKPPKVQQNRPTNTVAPAPFLLEAKNPLERAKAAISIMHSAPDEIPEQLASSSRKIAVANGYKQRVSQWNRTSAVETLKDQRYARSRMPAKRPRLDLEWPESEFPNDMATDKDEAELEHIEMEIHHKLAAKMVRRSDATSEKALDEYNYLMRKDFSSSTEIQPDVEEETNNSQGNLYETMQPLRESELSQEDWFNEVDDLELQTIGDQSTHWSTLTQASSTTVQHDFTRDFDASTVNGDQFDDAFGWTLE